ncbi:hypothetical protein F2Q69_00001076 [Brassica cretica]|uniref:Uncharacterized protein n=1 Tax=Brassica cretica TaxID=69181 RepID=A0A8S9P2K0_BRACR|nr:hypothetical protein F2Q69_00001076 [Brassica cretica]
MFSSPQIIGLWYQWPASFTRYQCPYIGSGRFGSSREKSTVTENFAVRTITREERFLVLKGSL